ncbi:MAG: hypothetical protein WCC86_01425 [Methanoregula sp.]|uniref:hypothetical protein n=1 Tax=Methanoregula sp. TaxID=2052170 RepID=UPI003BAF82B6
MNYILFACALLLILGVLCTGCIQGSSPASEVITINQTPVPLATAPNEALTVTPPILSLGNQYLQNSYSFVNQSDRVTEQIRIADPSWAIEFNITPLSYNIQDCWFEMKITNLDTHANQTFSWTYLNDTFQQYPMYTTGSYQIDMTGNLVLVKLDVAKRLP